MILASLLSVPQHVLGSVPFDQPWKARFKRQHIGICVA